MEKIDLFKNKNNFIDKAHVASIPVFEAKLNFIPRVTIAIPTYNRAVLLKESIESALNQMNYDNYDVIVVDNNPERGCATEELLLMYKNTRISYYKNEENIGMIGNLNRLYELARGEYVVELHDDDLLFPNYLSVMMGFVDYNRGEYDAVYPGKVIFNMKKEKEIPQQGTSVKLYFQNLRLSDFLWENIIGPPVGACVKKQSFYDSGGYDYDLIPSFDFGMYVKFSYQLKICRLVGYPLCIYRIENNESCKAETLLDFVARDRVIKKGILKTLNKFWLNYLWYKYNKYFVYIYLRKMVLLFHGESKIMNEIMSSGHDYENSDALIFRMLNIYRELLFKIRRVKYVTT
jgi:glycosyltransferase involved in cell wall biosynthesis